MSDKAEKKYNLIVPLILILTLAGVGIYYFRLEVIKKRVEREVFLANVAYFTAQSFKAEAKGMFPMAQSNGRASVVFDDEVAATKKADLETWQRNTGYFPFGLTAGKITTPSMFALLASIEDQNVRYAGVRYSMIVALDGPDGDTDIPLSAMPIASVSREILDREDFLFLDFPPEDLVYDPTNGFTSSGDIVVYDGAEGDLHTWLTPNYKAGFFSESYAEEHGIDLEKLKEEILR